MSNSQNRRRPQEKTPVSQLNIDSRRSSQDSGKGQTKPKFFYRDESFVYDTRGVRRVSVGQVNASSGKIENLQDSAVINQSEEDFPKLESVKVTSSRSKSTSPKRKSSSPVKAQLKQTDSSPVEAETDNIESGEESDDETVIILDYDNKKSSQQPKTSAKSSPEDIQSKSVSNTRVSQPAAVPVPPLHPQSRQRSQSPHGPHPHSRSYRNSNSPHRIQRQNSYQKSYTPPQTSYPSHHHPPQSMSTTPPQHQPQMHPMPQGYYYPAPGQNYYVTAVPISAASQPISLPVSHPHQSNSTSNSPVPFAIPINPSPNPDWTPDMQAQMSMQYQQGLPTQFIQTPNGQTIVLAQMSNGLMVPVSMGAVNGMNMQGGPPAYGSGQWNNGQQAGQGQDQQQSPAESAQAQGYYY
ncbi:hypothetical protein BKA69DRAFT_297011 [Paraphysoderma sedebokerense]|nr:hypothetical protein BKA69DRAFT_297011 [Paraphysoderma sedebokerense]